MGSARIAQRASSIASYEFRRWFKRWVSPEGAQFGEPFQMYRGSHSAVLGQAIDVPRGSGGDGLSRGTLCGRFVLGWLSPG